MFDDDCSSDNESESAWSLMARGDMGYRPGDAYPVVYGSTDRDKIWRATMGSTIEEHEKSLQYEKDLRAKDLNPAHICIYHTKRRARRKLAKMRKLEARKYTVSEVSLNDPDILPRNMKGDDYVNLYSAVAFANSRGVFFNIHLTINWEDLGFESGKSAESQLYNSFIRQYTEWCWDHSIEPCWIYSNEGSDRKGIHTHFMTSIDSHMLLQFRKYVEMRMRKINRLNTFNTRAYFIREIGDWEHAVQWMQVQYLGKGVDPNARLLHANGKDKVLVSDLIQWGYESPGDVACKKRCGVSRNIDRESRKWSLAYIHEGGFKSFMEKGIFNVNILYQYIQRKYTEAESLEILSVLDI